ncbi:MAG: hypothetical protein QOD06_2122 [Candidatus Binatota bacterium]|nr:hypothetical protein [Candidatus Binatota bacterium]
MYRVRYACERIMGVPPGEPINLVGFGVAKYPEDCPPNPATDDRGRPVDGPYAAPSYCPADGSHTGRCVPSSLVFSNTGKDAMCIPIIMYWPLDRVLNADGSVNEDATSHLEDGDVDSVGTPGRVWKSPSDSGICDDGAGPDGVNVADPTAAAPSGAAVLRPPLQGGVVAAAASVTGLGKSVRH